MSDYHAGTRLLMVEVGIVFQSQLLGDFLLEELSSDLGQWEKSGGEDAS